MLRRVKSHSEVNPEARWIQVALPRDLSPRRTKCYDAGNKHERQRI